MEQELCDVESFTKTTSEICRDMKPLFPMEQNAAAVATAPMSACRCFASCWASASD